MKILKTSPFQGSQKIVTFALTLLFFATPLLSGCSFLNSGQSQSGDIHKIQHVVVIMQENRSFDTYFGTFPGADGYPTRHGRITVCAPNPVTHRCVTPFPDHRDANTGGPHGQAAAAVDRAGSKMNGFIVALQHARSDCDSVNAP